MSGIHVPGRSNPTSNPLEVQNQHLMNLVRINTSIAASLQMIANNTKGPDQLALPHVAAVALTQSGAWGVFCLGCTANNMPSGDFVYPCQVMEPDPSHPWPPQLLMEVPESPEGHPEAPS